MKKIFTFLVVLTFFTSGVFAQYYFNTYNPAGTNPGGLNTDPEQPFGAAGVTAANGYTSIIANGTTTLSWSPVQTIPFPFSFNGSPVTQYKVSNSGVLTFTTSATTVPSFTNATIPNASIPDNSVMIWGLQQMAGNDGVLNKTHGTAPNRQHWINFASFSAPGASGQQWTYWGIVLEETTNNIYVVDLRTFNTPLSLTIGIQIDATTAYQIAGAPNTPSVVTNGGNVSDPSDNAYYEFIQGNRPTEDIEVSSLDLDDLESASSPITISGTITNKGSNTLNSFNIKWTADGGTTVNTEAITASVAPLGTYNFSHMTSWTPTAGASYDVQVYTDNPNGVADQNTINDTLTKRVFVNNGTTVSKNPLLEEFTTAPCQFCPDGAVVVEQILASNPSVIAVGEHACFGTDAMTIPEASTYCSAFGTGAPTACIDRVLFPGQTNVAHSRSLWASNANSQSMLGSPVNVTITGSYNATTRQVNADLTANFVDFALPGDLRVTLFVVEDHVRGTGSGYDQVNFYNTQSGHPYAGAGNPIVNYDHRHVLRDVYPTTNAWGDASVIPQSPAPNTPYTKNHSFVLNNAWDADSVSLVGFVSYFNSDVAEREVLNAFEVKLNNLTTGITEISVNSNNLSVYPNPTNSITNLEFMLGSASNVQLELFDLTGKKLRAENFGTLTQGKQRLQLNVEDLNQGFYFINLNVNGNIITKKISVIK